MMGRRWKHYLLELAFTVLWVFASSAVGWIFRVVGFPETNIVIIYILGVLMTARFTTDFAFGIIASIMSTFAFNYFFTAPYFTFAVDDPSYMITFVVMTIISIATSTLTARVKKSAAEAERRAAETRALYLLTNRLTDAKSIEDISVIAVRQISDMLQCSAAILCFDGEGKPDHSFVQCLGNQITVREYDECDDVAHRIEGAQSCFVEGNEFYEWPIYGNDGVLGVLRVPRECCDTMGERTRKLTIAMLESTALAMDRFRTEEERIRYREESEQEHYRGNLLRAISHDLRTPLSGIIGTSEMIMDMSNKSDPRYSLAQGIWKDADWLHSLVENILNLTRLEEGKLVLQKQPEAVEEIIGSALGHIKKRAPEYDINVEIPDEVLMVPMDAKLIVQVLVNLLDNAVKHTSPADSITVSAKKTQDEAVFCVTDRGEGIDSGDLPNIFKTFYTSRNRAADAKRGVGLGLAICDAIIKAHGGAITARNNESGGAEFTFTLPLADKG